MPRETFAVTIEEYGEINEKKAVASASAYLAYADKTDTFGYNPSITAVETISDSTGTYAVVITFETDIENDDHLRRFMGEMTMLSRVASVEREVAA